MGQKHQRAMIKSRERDYTEGQNVQFTNDVQIETKLGVILI